MPHPTDPPLPPGYVDVTAGPYHCDPTGRDDCTAALRQALDDVVAVHLAAYHDTLREREENPQREWIEINRKHIVFSRKVPPI
ncbi:MAG: hypothetical protein AAF710_10775 [Planctomycetota bacterium]